MDRGVIPPNLHYKTPSSMIPAIKEGRIKILTDCIPWEGEYAAVNTTSITGLAGNVILKSFKKDKKNKGEPDDDLIRVIIASGSTEESVAFILDQVSVLVYKSYILINLIDKNCISLYISFSIFSFLLSYDFCLTTLVLF